MTITALPDMKRRAFLGTTAVIAGVGAGCLGSANTSPDQDHPATRSLAGAPALGGNLSSVDSLIVAFEDPSCRICARFHTSTLPDLRANLIGEDVAFVYRAYPIRPYEWGDPAAEAIVATADRSNTAAWDLINHYYEAQSSFNKDNVLDQTATFLNQQTDIDGAAVVSDVREGTFTDRVTQNLNDGDEAGATTTPTFFIFDDGEFITKITGHQDADVFRNTIAG